MNVLDLNFIEAAKAQYPEAFKNRRVLEIGAQDVNGNVRGPFEDCHFIGIDWIAGKNVDIVVPAKDADFPPNSFDVLLSVNHLEHDPDWEAGLIRTMGALTSDGVLILRWGTRRSSPHGPEYDPHGKLGYYPKDPPEVASFLEQNGCHVMHVSSDHNPYIGVMGNIIARKI